MGDLESRARALLDAVCATPEEEGDEGPLRVMLAGLRSERAMALEEAARDCTRRWTLKDWLRARAAAERGGSDG